MLHVGGLICAMTLPAAEAFAPAPIAIELSSDNGSVPPPYRRSTEIEIDVAGHGRLVRRIGYDLQDPSQRLILEFSVSPEQQRVFADAATTLGAFSERWQAARRVTVGGPVVSLKLERGASVVHVPAFPITRQRERAAQLHALVRELVPASVTDTYRAWERENGGEE